MAKRMIVSGVFAGCAAGLIAVLLHFAFVQKYILLGEQYESGVLTHFEMGSDHHAAPQADAATHDHGADHSHSPSPNDLQRNGLTGLFMLIVYTSYGLILTAGFALAESFGRKIDAREGMLWGIAGFAAFQLAPAMGLAPELPGTIAADLGARQVWWWGTVISTGLGIATLAYGRAAWRFGLGAALLALPHVIGAPEPGGFFGTSPPEVAAAFSARVLGTALITWAALGWLAGHFWTSTET